MLKMVMEKTIALGATVVKSVVMYAHSWGVSFPDYIGIISKIVNCQSQIDNQ